MDKAFNLVHGPGAQLRDERMKDPIKITVSKIKTMCPDINVKIIDLFTKVKYHARVKSLNEQNLIAKRKSYDKPQFKKRIKTMRDYTKDGHFMNQ